jgi:hypothetical protein
MKTAIMQPYFFPYIGYFQLINAVDTFVLYDDVTYIKGGWINRNRIYENGDWNYWGLPVKNASSHRLIKDIEYIRDWQRLLKTIQQNYGRTPYADAVWNQILLEAAGNQKEVTISALNEYIVSKICKYLGITTTIIKSSDLSNLKDGRVERLCSICEQTGATTYINAIGGQILYSKEQFKEQGINLQFLKTNEIIYQQFDKSFVPNLSILDVLMFNSKEEIGEMLNNYELI